MYWKDLKKVGIEEPEQVLELLEALKQQPVADPYEEKFKKCIVALEYVKLNTSEKSNANRMVTDILKQVRDS